MDGPDNEALGYAFPIVQTGEGGATGVDACWDMMMLSGVRPTDFMLTERRRSWQCSLVASAAARPAQRRMFECRQVVEVARATAAQRALLFPP